MRTRELVGLAHGWEGPAWVALHSALAGIAAVEPAVMRRIERRLVAACAGRDADWNAGPGALIGRGGAASVAVLAAAYEPRFAKLATTLVARWVGSEAPRLDDVMLGHAGALLAASELVARAPGFRPPRSFLRRCHAATVAALRRALRTESTVLGFAHGIAGLMLAIECGVARFGLARDRDLVERGFERLAVSRVIAPGLGTLWPHVAGDGVVGFQGWCHGAPGIALALAGCHRFSGEAHYDALFREAAPALVGLRSPEDSLCCGRLGRAHVLLERFRHRGEPAWLASARAVAAEPSGRLSTARGLWKGRGGADYLALRAQHPAVLPLPGTGC